MSKRISIALTGLILSISSVGCCCLGGGMMGGGCNRCAPCGGCPTGGGGYYAPQTGAIYNGMDATQSAYLPGYQTSSISNTAIIGAPVIATNGGYTTSAMVPVNQLPTYH